VPWVGDLTSHVDVVLDRHRHPEQRALVARPAPCLGLLRLRQRALSHHRPERVQLGVDARDPLEVELDELGRGHVAGADQLRLVGDAGECQIGCIHGRQVRATPATRGS
jgi:hypothetical protein